MITTDRTLRVRAEIGGFGHLDWLQLDTYFDTERLRSTLRPGSLVTVSDYVEIMRCGRRLWPSRPSVFDHEFHARMPSDTSAQSERPPSDANLDPARMLDALIVFVWWEEERAGLQFRPPIGLVDCHERLLLKGHVRRIRVEGGAGRSSGEDWFQVDKMKEGTDNRTIDAPNMLFRRVFCADPYILDHTHTSAVSADLTRGKWLDAVSRHLQALDSAGAGAVSHQGESDGATASAGGGVLSMALASYRRTALAHLSSGEDRWGSWSEDEWMAKQVALPKAVFDLVQAVRATHLPGAYISVHLRAGRILNRGTVDGGEGVQATNRFRRIPYLGADLAAVLQYPLQCAQTLIEQVQARKEETGLQHVYLASDLVEGMMPELDVTNPATTIPLMQPEHRQQLIENVKGAWELLRLHLDPVVLSQELVGADGAVAAEAGSAGSRRDDACPDTGASVDVPRALSDKGLSAIVDRELLAHGQVFMYAGQYAGRCEATGYSQGVRERRRALGMPEASSIYVSQCCIVDSPEAYLPP